MMKTKHSKLTNKMSKLQASKALKDFCESTTLHGYSHFYIADSTFSKMFWAIIMLVTTGIGITLLVINTKAYMDATIVTNIESVFDNLHVSNLRRGRGAILETINFKSNCDSLGCRISIYNYL